MPELRTPTEPVNEWTIEELTAVALAADPTESLDDDAVPFAVVGSESSLLPSWYMPAPQSFAPTRRRRAVVWTFVGSLLLLNAAGLCVTYGVVEIAW